MLTVEWANAVTQLDRGEAAYATGDDPAVFSHLRGALDALPGAKKHVLDGVSDTNKRSRLDTLLKDAGEFLHTGRHVAKLGEQAGSFPVTHVDAAFALDLRCCCPHVAPPCRRQPLGHAPYPCTRFPLGSEAGPLPATSPAVSAVADVD